VRHEHPDYAFTVVLFDVDGTLVDSNDAHARAWVDAFAESGLTVDPREVRQAIGMGGDKLIPTVSQVDPESALGKTISARRRTLFQQQWLPRLHGFRDADRLVAALHDRGFRLVAASSAKRDELPPLLEIAGVVRFFQASTSSDDAERSKPDPDIVRAALERAGAEPGEAVMIGDTPYDIEAAGRAGVASIAFRCGGWNQPELAGAAAIYDGPWDLLQQLDDSAIARPRRHGQSR
jgi:HAD superfamily hydrolase (TIGR01509 family)